VLGVEIDEQMAEVAREHGVTVETDSFEGWDDRGRTFDLITCGQGWHWIDPDAGARKAARLLRPGGALALCWNYEVPDDELRADLDRVYREHAPELAGKNHRHDQDGHLESLRRTNAFATIETKRYRWAQTLTADEWVGRVSTFSDHIGLAADRRERLLAGLRELAEARGGALDLPFGTYTTIARTPE
jgi:SAM-dependent methyltransferase